MRLSGQRLSAGVLAILLELTVAIPPAQARPRDHPSPVCDRRERTTPEGIAVVIPIDHENPTWSDADIKKAMDNPYIRGVMVQIRWSTLEPTEGKPEWSKSKLEMIVNEAEKHRQWVHLAVFPGFFSPSWALKDVKTDTFTVPYGPESGKPMSLPMPWDETYLKRWYALMREVAKKYGSSTAFRMIGAAGPTSVSDEMTLPQGPAAVTQWLNDGYTPKKYLDAWSETFKELKTDFPSQCVSVSAPGVPILRGGKGKIGPGARMTYKHQVVSMAQAVLGDQLAIQSNNLHAGPVPHDAYNKTDFINGYSGKITTGFMMRSGSQTPAGSSAMGAAGHPPLALMRSINKGLVLNASGAHVDYLEIYIADVLPEDMQDDLKKTARRFEHAKGN